MVKSRRRVHWTRQILKYVLLICAALCLVISAITLITSNELTIDGQIKAAMEDKTPPVIELKGGDKMTIAVGDVLAEPGVAVYDESSWPEVEIDSEVDVAHEGEYEIHYTATDESGNIATVKRDVKVMQPAGRVYLTFDDGPSEYTGTLVDVLNKYGVKATFFVTGYGDDALIKREYDEGHAVGVHTMSHVYSYIYANKDNFWEDFNAVQDRVRRVTGQNTVLMRFPGGSSNLISALYDGGSRIMSALVDEVTARGYTYYDWNIDSGDAGGASTADEVYNNVTRVMGDGGEYVVLQHDVKPYSVEAVERIIQYGLEHNFVFSALRPNSFSAHHGVNN